MVNHASPEEYTELSQRYIRQAEEEFQKGDFLQASEKAWGAVAVAAKSAAAHRRWRHHNHALLYDVSGQIADELRRPDLARLFRSASSLHINFYENWMGAGHVRGGIDDAANYVRELEATLAAQPPTFIPQTTEQTARLRRLTAS